MKRKLFIYLSCFTLIISSIFVLPQEKAKANPLLAIAGSVVLDLAFNAVMNRIGYGPGSTATQDDYIGGATDTYSKLTAEEKAHQAWNMDNYEPSKKKSGWGKWAVPLSLVTSVFGLAGSSMVKEESYPTIPEDIKAQLPLYLNPENYNFVFTAWNSSTLTNYVYLPEEWRSHLLHDTKYGWAYYKQYAGYVSSIKLDKYSLSGYEDSFYVTIVMPFLEGGSVSRSFWIDIPFGMSLLGFGSTPVENTRGTEYEPVQDSYMGEDGQEYIDVEIPDPSTIVTYEDLQKYIDQLKTTPEITTPNPDNYTDWDLGDIFSPLDGILKVLKDMWEWLKTTIGNIPEWMSSILSKLADLFGLLSEWFGKFVEWTSTLLTSLTNWFADLLSSLGEWFSTLWDWLGNILSNLSTWFSQLFSDLALYFSDLWKWLGDLLNGILGLPQLIWETSKQFLIPTEPMTDLFTPLKITVEEKFNTPSDFAWLTPALSSEACPPDITFSGLKVGQGSYGGTAVDTTLACDTAPWWKPIMTGFMYFLFGWWCFRKMNALMSKRGGT